MAQSEFLALIHEISETIGDRPLDAALEAFLNTQYPDDGAVFARLSALCAKGEAEGWLMAREGGGIKYGRAVKPGEGAGNFSVDVVRMKNVKGPHHIHTTGEIGAVMAIDGAPNFDHWPVGWYVYAPGSDHNPTVTGGEAYVLYLLPGGEIEFTGR